MPIGLHATVRLPRRPETADASTPADLAWPARQSPPALGRGCDRWSGTAASLASAGQSFRRTNLMNQHVAAFGRFHNAFVLTGVTRKYDRPVGTDELVSVRGPGPVRDPKGVDFHMLVFINQARFHFLRSHLVSRCAGRFQSVDSLIDIGLVSDQNMFRQMIESRRPVHLKRLVTTIHPRRQNQVRIPGGVVRVQMGQESAIKQIGREAADTLVASGSGAARTTPGPKSIMYGWSFTTIASEGPKRSGSAPGVPVPSNTTIDCPLRLRRRERFARALRIAGHFF